MEYENVATLIQTLRYIEWLALPFHPTLHHHPLTPPPHTKASCPQIIFLVCLFQGKHFGVLYFIFKLCSLTFKLDKCCTFELFMNNVNFVCYFILLSCVHKSIIYTFITLNVFFFYWHFTPIRVSIFPMMLSSFLHLFLVKFKIFSPPLLNGLQVCLCSERFNTNDNSTSCALTSSHPKETGRFAVMYKVYITIGNL